jgi:putative transposase
MSGTYYSEIHLHVVWHTKQSLPLLTPAIETFAHDYVRRQLIEAPGLYVHAIGGTETHLHIALDVTPQTVISEVVGKLKGGSAHEVNQVLGRGRKVLEWQSGYGVVSFGSKDLDWVIDYVKNQKEHHRLHTVHDRLERTAPPEAMGSSPLQREGP